MCGRGAYTWSNKNVKKRWAYLRGPIRRGLIGGEIRYSINPS